MAIAKFDSVAIPNVQSQVMAPVVIRDEARTASGKMCRDVVVVKRQWKLTASYLTPAQRDAILNLLSGKSYGTVAFWLDEFGAESNTVISYVTVESVGRVPFGQGGTWYENGANMELTIEEQ